LGAIRFVSDLYFYALGAGSKLLNLRELFFHVGTETVGDLSVTTFDDNFHDVLLWHIGRCLAFTRGNGTRLEASYE